MSTALWCAGLGHRYGRKIWGLRDCDLDVPAGRVVALVGPNGSGKTTLMSMAAGLLPASTGTVEAAGGAPARRLDRIGFVAQDAPLWPRLRVADVLEVGRCMNRGFDAVMAAERVGRLGIRPGRGSAPCPAASGLRWRSPWCWPRGQSCSCSM